MKLKLCPHGMIPGICTQCGAEKPNGGVYDLTMILGAGFDIPADGVIKGRPARELCNIESIMRLDAGGIFYEQQLTERLMTTGGVTELRRAQGFPSLGELGQRYLLEEHEVPTKAVMTETKSDATHANLRYGLQIVAASEINISRFAVLSTNYHLERARIMLEMMGIAADLIPAESVLIRYLDSTTAGEVADWLFRVENTGIMANELAKISDQEYWNRRREFLAAPLDQDPPVVDISADVAATARRLESTGAKGVQTETF